MKQRMLLFAALLCCALMATGQPLNDIADRTVMMEKPALPYPALNERDIFWQKTVWQVLDVREKMNLPFAYPKRPFFSILLDAAMEGELTLYADGDFTDPLTTEEIQNIISEPDTAWVYNRMGEAEPVPVFNDLDPESVKQFRLFEVWYFDAVSSTMKVRILGIAPVLSRYSENGDFIGDMPLFWVHYPSARSLLAQEVVFTEGNENKKISWEDWLEMRHFTAYIVKEGNVRDNRLQELYSGVDQLLESQKIRDEIFNFEQDLWSH
ncbi:MAG: gliding motility protein GldN [Saprospirales bacterium]|nr:gliding motility protein GldN [Saprospirales bacterium]